MPLSPESKEISFRQSAGCLAVLLFLLMLPCVHLLFQQHKELESRRLALIAESQEQEAVAALKHDRPHKPKEKKKMAVKIVRGKMGQADYTDSSLCAQRRNYGGGDIWYRFNTVPPGDLPLGFGYRWSVRRGESTTIATNFSPNGWSVSSTGQVTVPVGAELEDDYWCYYAEEGVCEPEGPISPPDVEGAGSIAKFYAFEVVCMKVAIHPYTRMSY